MKRLQSASLKRDLESEVRCSESDKNTVTYGFDIANGCSEPVNKDTW